MAQDLRYAARTLGKSPGFAAVAVFSLAMGMGANTAIFSLIDGVMLRMLPVSHPEQLMFADRNQVEMGRFKGAYTIAPSVFRQMQDRATSVAGLCSAGGQVRVGVAWEGQTGLASGQFVSSNYFTLLGVPAVAGRTFGPNEDRPDSRVAVLGFGYWQRRFGGNPGAIGRQIGINGVPFTVVGVTPREFYGTSIDSTFDIVMPFVTLAEQRGRMPADPANGMDPAGRILVRLKPGVHVSRAAAELTAIFRAAARDEGSEDREAIDKTSIELTPAGRGYSGIRNRFSEALRVLMVVAGLVLLIAGTNVANLLLAKTNARRREIAIRLSLGSSRARLVRQLMTEGLLLSILGGGLGWVFAMWARQGIISIANAKGAIPNGWNLRVLAFTGAACFLNVLVFGTVPALRATRIDLSGALKSGRGGESGGHLPLSRVLIVAQASLSLALVVGAVLFIESFRNLDSVDTGYDREHSLLATIDPAYAGYKGAAADEIGRRVLARAGRVPGVRGAAFLATRLMTGAVNVNGVYVPGYVPKRGEDTRNLWVITQAVSAGFFRVSGIRLVAGRDFSDRDEEGGPSAAVISQSLAEHFFSGKDPVGRQLAWSKSDSPMTIVGVVRDIKVFGMREDSEELIFTPLFRSGIPGSATLWVRTTSDPARVAGQVRDAIRSVDAKLPQFDLTTVEEQVADSLAEPRLLAVLAGAFGLFALILATIGLYGVISYDVTRRTHEIGVRMALGAERVHIWRLVVGNIGRLLAIGMGMGAGLAIAGARVAASLLFGVTALDVWPIASGLAVLTAAGLAGAVVPAVRASGVEPTIVLRQD